jgi:nucleoside-diphosphate-sugar epimerase
MKLLLIGGTSSLALILKPLLSEFTEVITAGRHGCDIVLDLADPLLALNIPPGFDTVINCAAYFAGDSAEDMIKAEIINVLGALKLCLACTQTKVAHFVQISTALAGLDPESKFYNAYTLSKKNAEDFVQLYAVNFGLPLLVIRPSQIYGAGESFRKHQEPLYTIMDKAQKNQEIVIYGPNDALRNYIHAEDVAMAITMAVRNKIVGNYACIYPENVRISQVANAAIAAFGSDKPLIFAPEMPAIQDNAFVLDDTLYQAIGYCPQISIVTGMQKEAARRLVAL